MLLVKVESRNETAHCFKVGSEEPIFLKYKAALHHTTILTLLVLSILFTRICSSIM
jgi:hypothetical protein